MTYANIFVLLLIFIPLTLLWVFALWDLSGRTDLSGAAKGLWAVAIVLLPLVGMLIYFVMIPQDSVSNQPPRVVSGTDAPPTITDDRMAELAKCAQLRDDGVLTDEEFSDLKARIIG